LEESSLILRRLNKDGLVIYYTHVEKLTKAQYRFLKMLVNTFGVLAEKDLQSTTLDYELFTTNYLNLAEMLRNWDIYIYNSRLNEGVYFD
jgi:hypothetical protein